MTLKLIAGPATEPLTLTEAKLHLRVTNTAEDDLITAFIVAAREAAEHETGRSLITQTWEQVIDAFPPVEIELGWPDVLSVVSVKYTDLNSTEQTIDPANYVLDSTTSPGWLLPAYAYVWPSTLDTVNAVRVRFTTGYGAASDVPEGIKAWMKLRIGTLYRFREEVQAGAWTEMPGRFVGGLLDKYRVYA
jgi:uncharacterized phiE125 gp8 family phage protein